jgi:hypothetical protein
VDYCAQRACTKQNPYHGDIGAHGTPVDTGVGKRCRAAPEKAAAGQTKKEKSPAGCWKPPEGRAGVYVTRCTEHNSRKQQKLKRNADRGTNSRICSKDAGGKKRSNGPECKIEAHYTRQQLKYRYARKPILPISDYEELLSHNL